ncbi:MAG TPA: efflux RND transporter permease subunit, partial [Bryobacteraceae bacterium]
FAIMVSLLVSFTLTPMLSSRFLKLGQGNGSESTKDTILFRALAGPYRSMLHWSMSHRWAIVAIAAVVMFSTVPLFMAIGKDFLPTDDQSEFEVTIRMPVGSSLAGSEAEVRDIEAELRKLPGVKNLLTLLGADSRRQVDRGSILVELVPVHNRTASQQAIMLEARSRLKKFRDLTIGVQPPSIIQGGGPNKDLMFFIQGPDFNRLEKYVAELNKVLAATPGVRDLDSSYEPGKPELRVHINRDKAADLNVNVASVATALRTLVGGDDQATTYREGEDRYDVQLRVQKEFRDSRAALDRLYVPSATLGNVPLSNVVTVEEGGGPSQIDRVNRQRQIMISANLVEGQALSNVIPLINRTVEGLNMPPEYRSGLLGRSKEFGRASLGYVIAVLLSIIFMYMVLASNFESFIDPITILISLPLSVPFALLTLVFARENYSIIYTSLGILMLFGIVKKNAILQIDHIKALRFKHGVPRREAIFRGCEDRLRPILMTTAALVAGMLPMAVGGGAGAGSRRSVAIVVIGGQTLCLLLTLLATPVAYSLFDDLGHLKLWPRLRALFSRRAAVAVPLLVLALLAVASPAAAQTRVGVGQVQRKLTLDDAIELALKNNLDIEIEKTNRAAAQEAARGARGFFDPTFRWAPDLESRATPSGSVLSGANGTLAEHALAQNFYFRQKLPWQGASLGLDFENSRQSSSNPFASLNPYFTSRLLITFTQPLLRNRSIDPQRAELKIRRRQVDLSDIDFELRNIEIVTLVEQAYWDLSAARQRTGVLSDNVEWGREQLARNKRMAATGSLAPVEISAAEAELERRLDSYYSGVGIVTEAENTLKTLLTSSREDPLWSDEILPVDVRTFEPPEAGDLKEATITALLKRPELRSIAVRQDVAGIEKQLSADQVKPQFNLVAGYANTGLGGTISSSPNPFSAATASQIDRLNELSVRAGLPPLPVMSFGALPGSLVGGYGTTLSNLFGGNYQSFQAGVSFDLTLRNRTAEAGLARSVIAERRVKLERTRAEQTIEAQVRNALQALTTARQRIVAAEASARAAKDKLDSETRLFQTGESTNFLVLTRQNEYADSRQREVVARLDANKSIARLRQAIGATLEAHGIRLQ